MLASEDGSFVTGTEIRIDGGTHIRRNPSDGTKCGGEPAVSESTGSAEPRACADQSCRRRNYSAPGPRTRPAVSVDDPGGARRTAWTRPRSSYCSAGQQVPRSCVLDTQTQTLTVQPRFASPDSTALAAPFKLTDASAPTGDAWEDLESVLASIAISAAGRGEFWLAELGGWDSPHEPNCLFTTVDESGLANAVMEANPAPVGLGVWPEA
ncbi:unnamed protein product, partial [Mesorhabditis spiculigera]